MCTEPMQLAIENTLRGECVLIATITMQPCVYHSNQSEAVLQIDWTPIQKSRWLDT